MAIFLKKYQINNGKSTVDKYWGYRTVAFETVDIDALAKHMANHNTPYSQGCIRGVLKDMCDCVKEILLEGKKVKIGDLAIFYLGVSCNMVASEKDLNVTESVKTLNFNAQGTGQLSLRGTTLRQQASFKVLGSGGTASASDGDSAADDSTTRGDDTASGGGSTSGGSTSGDGSSDGEVVL